jgi:putative endonuclease
MSLLQPQRLRALEGFVQAARRAAKRLGRLPQRAEHLETGQRGEEAAYFYLRRNGFVVVARGWRNAKLRGDLDLIAWEGATLCFVEVKTRSSREVATAESSVDEDKMQMLRRMARQYIRSMPAPPELTRFDILSVYFKAGSNASGAADLELFRDAFTWY